MIVLNPRKTGKQRRSLMQAESAGEAAVWDGVEDQVWRPHTQENDNRKCGKINIAYSII